MAIAAPKGFCAVAGCSVRCRGYCPAHQRARHQVLDADRGNRHQRGYTSAWARYSKRRLAVHPWCVGFPAGAHADAPRLAECTDHIRDAVAHPDLFWEPTNHQSLCFACNARKAKATKGATWI
jgi:5-methylcytosine-specific restriction enzyme A